jgi:DNA-directed RNA polymerase subunit L
MQILNVTADMFDIYPLKQEYEELLEEQAEKDISIEENIYNKIESMSTEYYDMDNPLSLERKKEIFRPFKFRNYELSYFFITELKNTNSEDINEEIELYCCPTIGYSKDHARWNNIPIAVTTFKKDEELLKKVIEEEIKINKIKDKDNFIKDFTLSNSERYFHKDNNLEPYWYDFTLQSNHIYTPKELYIRSIDILINKFDIVNKNLLILKNKSLKASESEDEDDNEDNINDYSFNKLKVDNTYTLTMVNENDTVGNIIQTHAVDKYIDDTSYITFCGYKKPHPLINKIIFNLMVSPSDNNEQQKLMYVINFFININKDIIEILKKIKDESENKLPS